MEYRCEIVESVAGLQQQLEAWRRARPFFQDDSFYTSPDFILSALQHYGHRHPYKIVFIYEKKSQGWDLIGVAPFSLQKPSPHVPLLALSSLDCPHGYLAHPLFRADRLEIAAEVLWGWIEDPKQPWSLVVLRQVDLNSIFWMRLRACLERKGRPFQLRGLHPRAVLYKEKSFDAYMSKLSRTRRSKLRRNLRRLEKSGGFESVLHRNLDACPDLAQRFIELERASWKGDFGTALASSAEDVGFFTDMVRRAAATSSLFFVELRMDGKPIAISSNFVQDSALYGFKIAYDAAWSRVSPGLTAELEAIRYFYEFPELTRGDGGTSGPSYLDSLWFDSTHVASIHIATQKLAARVYHEMLPWAVGAKNGAARIFQRLRGSAT